MAVTSNAQHVVDVSAPKGSLIYDIKGDCDAQQVDLHKQIVEGLKTVPPSMPPLLLWNDIGLKLFETLTQEPAYMPFRSEIEILHQHADQMAESMPSGSLLIELGSGSLHKTSIILSAFERQQREISYYALDISRGELTDGLDKLGAVFGGSQYVKLRGLLGSYEDGVGWLAGYATSDMPKTVTFLWVGNSIANLTRSEAGSLLAEFVGACQNLRINCQFIISMDACQDEDKVLAGYHDEGPLSPFILNGLHHANLVLGDEVFRRDDWKFARDFDPTDRTLRMYYEAVRDVDLHVDGRDLAFRKGDRITAVASGKWTEDDVQLMCADAGLEVVQVWPSAEKDYAFYTIKPRLS